MGTIITKEEVTDSSWANSEQPKEFSRDMLLCKTATWHEYVEQEHILAKAEIEGSPKKVRRKAGK
jgi:hypothetical protein